MFACIDNTRRKGFGIIEALVATGLILILLFALVGAIPFLIKANKDSEQRSLASAYARAKLEELSTVAYDEMSVGTIEARARLASDPTDAAYLLERETVVSLVDQSFTPSMTDVGLKKIQVYIYWPNRQGGWSLYDLVSLRSRK